MGRKDAEPAFGRRQSDVDTHGAVNERDAGTIGGAREASKTPGLRQSLTWRWATSYLLAISFVLVALSIVIYLFTAVYVEGRLEAELEAQADFYAVFAARAAPDERSLIALAPTIAAIFAPRSDLTLRLFAASDGGLLAATQDIGPQPSRAASLELRFRGPSVFTQPSRNVPHRLYVARSVVIGGDRIGVVEVSRSTLVSGRFLSSLRHVLLTATLAAVAVCLLISVFLAHRLSQPIREMEQATRRIERGDLDIRISEDPPGEIGRLAKGINEMAEQLKRLETARAQLISEISHDLRTPLTAIKGLLVNLIDSSRPDERRSLETAEREADRLIRLVNQLLDFSRWQSGHLELNRRATDLGLALSDAVAMCAERASHRGVALEAAVPDSLPRVFADPDRLQRIILNLLDNAIKFTPRGGQVALAAAERDGAVEVSVRDTGRGMSDEEQQRAFEPYYRGQGGGAGLGLTIAQAIVEAHGGQMGIESSPGHGSCIWFTLPL